MGPTLVYHAPAEQLPHLRKRFSTPGVVTSTRSGWISPRRAEDRHSTNSGASTSSKRYAASQRPSTPASAFPDIEWDPSLETYLSRVEKLASLRESLPQAVPDGFPTTIESARTWQGADFEDDCTYVYSLSADDLDEIDTALQAFKEQFASYPSPELITPETFPLPNLASKLTHVSHVIHTGQGFFVIRGLDPHRYPPLERVLAYVGVTSYIGRTRACQDAGGSRLIHIKDRGMAFPGAEMRQAPYSNVQQPFHTDACDILVMYVQELAAEGGHFKLASSAKIYNDIAATRPDVIHTLAADEWIFDKFSSDGPPAWEVRPILLPFGPAHGPSFFYSRRPLTGSPVAPHTPGVPPMTERQAEALDMVHFTAVENQLSLKARRGDIIVVNNLAVMHARDTFVDDVSDDSKRRHVLRLWLRNEELQWPKPDAIKPILDLKYDADSPWCRDSLWHLEPPTLPERLLARRFTCS